jgi:hypothetical protein
LTDKPDVVHHTQTIERLKTLARKLEQTRAASAELCRMAATEVEASYRDRRNRPTSERLFLDPKDSAVPSNDR